MTEQKPTDKQTSKVEVIDLRDPWRLEIAHPGTHLYEQAVALEATMFDKWFRNSAEELAEAYSPYDGQMELVAVVAPGNHLAGVTRHAWSTPGRPSLSFLDMSSPPFNLDISAFLARVGGHEACLDILTMAAAPGMRNGDLSMATVGIIGAAYYQTQRRGQTWFVTVMDEFILDYLNSTYGLGYRRMNDSISHPYMGSPASVPCELGVDEAGRRVNGPVWEVTHGTPAKANMVITDELLTPVEAPIDLRERAAPTPLDTGSRS